MKTGKRYRPSNGSEGCCFYAAWCENCQRDKPMSEGKDYDACDDSEVCKIIAGTLAYDVDHPKYPQEWTHDKDGVPCCTKFLAVGKEPERITTQERAANLELPL